MDRHFLYYRPPSRVDDRGMYENTTESMAFKVDFLIHVNERL